MSEKAQVTVSIPDETRDELDREADRRGTHRSAAVVQIVDEWDERGETIAQLRDELGDVREERARLSAQLEERADESDEAPWAEQTFGLSTAAAAIFGVAAALSWVASELLSVASAEPLAFGLALVSASSVVTAAGGWAAMRRAADPAPDEEADPA